MDIDVTHDDPGSGATAVSDRRRVPALTVAALIVGMLAGGTIGTARERGRPAKNSSHWPVPNCSTSAAR